MAAQKGSDLLIKMEDDSSPAAFTTMAGLRTKTFVMNAEQVDITNSDSLDKWRELLEGAGIKSASVSGAGVFKDSAVEAAALTNFMNGSIRDYQILIPNFGTFEGPFQITQYQFAGEHSAEVTYDIALESAGKITFTAL